MNGQSITAPLVKFLIFVLVTVLATGVLVLTIANQDLRSSQSYTARFTDVTALNEGDDVRIAGVKVGEVESIRVVDRRLAEVRFNVADRRLPASVTATIKYRNLVGQRYIALDQGPGDPSKFLPPGGTIPLQRTKPALDLTVLLGGFKPLFQALSPTDVNKLSYEIIQVLQGEGGTVESLLAHTASLTSTIASRDQVIGQVINNLNGVLGTVNARDQQLSGLIGQLRQVVSGLSADRGAIGDADITLASHVGCVMMGEWKAEVDGKVISGAEALKTKGITPLVPYGKDGLGILSSNSVGMAYTMDAARTMHQVMKVSPLVYGLTLQGLNGNVAPFLAQTVNSHPLPGLAERLVPLELRQKTRSAGSAFLPHDRLRSFRSSAGSE